MKLHFNSSKPLRIAKGFTGYYLNDPLCTTDWWYNITLRQWEVETDKENCHYSTHADCKSIKAFRRALKKAPAGVRFTLVFYGLHTYDVDGIGSNRDLFAPVLYPEHDPLNPID